MAKKNIKPAEEIQVESIEAEKIEVTHVEPEVIKPVEVFNEPKSADEIYQFIVELHTDSERLQAKAAASGIIPTSLQVVTYQLMLCKNNIARALGK